MSDKDLRPTDGQPEKKQDNSVDGSRRQNTRMIIWGVAGAYLLYLSVKMVKDLMGGMVEGQGTKIMVIVSSIVFTGAAIFLLVQCIRHALSSFKASVRDMADAQDAEDAEEEIEQIEEAEPQDDEDSDDADNRE